MIELTIRANVVLFGLSEALSLDLTGALAKLGGNVEPLPIATADECLTLARQGADVVFCKPDADLVRELRRQCPKAVIIAASRIPNTEDWLETVEAGADDYCAAPFESHQLQWMLETSLYQQRPAA